MKNIEFPVFGTKLSSDSAKFDLTDLKQREEYFQHKAGDEIAQIKKYLAQNNFIAYFIGKKNSGKGTYSKLFAEVVGTDKAVHISVGDLVRDVSSDWENYSKNAQGKRAKELYRGYISFDEAVERLLSRSQSNLLPTEFILALLRAKVEELEGKSLFLDGFPRDEDQISYALFFKQLIGRGDSNDMFILIDIPNNVINERIKYRVVCPVCKTPRNTKLLATKEVGFDEQKGEYFLMCDNPSCSRTKMVGKEGDELGIEPIKDRLIKDEQIIEKIYNISGVDKVLLRNSVPEKEANQHYDTYEITPAYIYEKDLQTKKIVIKEAPWVVNDDREVPSYSLLPPPVVVSLIKQISKILSPKEQK